MDLDALYKLTHGLYILGAKGENYFAGSVVDAVMQVANQPVVIALSCGNNSYTKECIECSDEFSLSVLGKNVDPKIIADFGFQTSRTVNKWEGVEYLVRDGLPYLADNLAILKAKVLQKIVYASNTLFIAEVVDCASSNDGEILTYADYRHGFKDKVIAAFKAAKEEKVAAEAPKEMPKETSKGLVKETAAKTADKHWVCTVCGYVYDEPTPFEELPDDWVCPLCGVDKSMFVYQ